MKLIENLFKQLIVDDEPIIWDILSKVVSSEGYVWGIA
jgi:CheY-like chemotaxis protein